MTRLLFDQEKQSISLLIEALIDGYQRNCEGKRELESMKVTLIDNLKDAEEEYIRRAREKQLHLISQRDALINPNIDMRLLEIYRGRINENIFLPEMVKISQTCCYCGIKSKVTHEHVLKKESYYQYAISPCNLVPACSDCNNGKGAWSIDNDQKRTPFHPYFENYDFRPMMDCNMIIENQSNHRSITDIDSVHYFEMEIDIQQNSEQFVDIFQYERYMNNYKMFKLKKIYSIYANAIIEEFVVEMKRYQESEGIDLANDIDYLLEALNDRILLKEKLDQAYSFMNSNYSELLALRKLKVILTAKHNHTNSQFINWINSSSTTI